MKNLILLAVIFMVSYGYGQSTAIVGPNPSRNLDIAILPFGMEYPIKVGDLSQSGKVTLNGNMDFTDVPKSMQSEYTMEMNEILDFCDNADELMANSGNIEGLELGASMLLSDGELVGFLTLVTDTALFDWASDQEAGNPVVGSVFELIYVNTPFDFSGECKGIFDVGSEEVVTEFMLDIHFKSGLNFMEYNIQSIQHIDSEEDTSFPQKVRVSSHPNVPSNSIWMAGYY